MISSTADRAFRQLAVATALACCLATTFVMAQEPEAHEDLPAVFAALEGVWEGTGVLMQRPAAFRMEWQTGSAGFARLSFANAWVDGAGNRTPVLRSEAIYLASGSTIQGVWIDSRPQRLRLSAVATDSSLVTTWTGESERGRTEYLVRSANELGVRDFVEMDGEFRLFGEARYTRREAPG